VPLDEAPRVRLAAHAATTFVLGEPVALRWPSLKAHPLLVRPLWRGYHEKTRTVKVLAQGKDPAGTKAGELGQGKPVTIGADDSVDETLHTMVEHKVRRLPVIDGHRLIGIVSQADLAKAIDETKVGELVEAISAAP
jgi:CBS domain-containing protein